VASALIRKGLREELTGADVESTLRAWFRALSEGQIFLYRIQRTLRPRAGSPWNCGILCPTASISRPPSAWAWR
jgi:hypothetical protein